MLYDAQKIDIRDPDRFTHSAQFRGKKDIKCTRLLWYTDIMSLKSVLHYYKYDILKIM